MFLSSFVYLCIWLGIRWCSYNRLPLKHSEAFGSNSGHSPVKLHKLDQLGSNISVKPSGLMPALNSPRKNFHPMQQMGEH